MYATEVISMKGTVEVVASTIDDAIEEASYLASIDAVSWDDVSRGDQNIDLIEPKEITNEEVEG